MMEIDVALLPQLAAQDSEESAAVGLVIDTLRFTTTAAEALQAAASIRVASEVSEAQALKAELIKLGSVPLLCGERHCKPIAGFDLGNSPFEYTQDKVTDRQLIFTTTNGTRAVKAVHKAAEIWLVSLTNRAAVVAKLLALQPAKVDIVCSGTEGEVTREDCLAAGAVVHNLLTQMEEPESVSLNDSANMCRELWRPCENLEQEGLASVLAETLGGRNILRAGYERDLGFAANVDSCPVVPKSVVEDFSLFQA